jgi:hypothetical protein
VSLAVVFLRAFVVKKNRPLVRTPQYTPRCENNTQKAFGAPAAWPRFGLFSFRDFTHKKETTREL